MIYIMGLMQSKVYKKAKAFSKSSKVVEFQSFIPCITSKTNRRMKQICKNQLKKLHILNTYLKREEWFGRKSTVLYGAGEFMVFHAPFLGAHIII